MLKHKNFRLFVISLAMFSSLNLRASDAGTAGIGKMIGAALVMHGGYSLYKDYGVYKTATARLATNPTDAAAAALKKEKMIKMGLDMLEIAGGAMAMMQNAQSQQDMQSGMDLPDSPAPAGGAAGGSPFGDTKPADMCADMPGICKNDPENRPILTLPPKAELKKGLKDSFAGQPVNADGLSLEDALRDLDDKYDQAANAFDQFNDFAAAGGLDSLENSELAGVGSGEGDGESVGLNKANNRDPAGAAGGNETFTLPDGSPVNWDALLTKSKADRGSPKAAKAVGLNLEDAKSGKIMNIWERVTRAIRGTRDRDLLFGKVEWTRKEAARKVEKSGRRL